MQMLKVTSSQIAEMGFDGVTMRVVFTRGKPYVYKNVTQEIFDQILNAPSVGIEFNNLIKSRPDLYPYKPE